MRSHRRNKVTFQQQNNETQHLLRSVHRFVRIIQQRHLSCVEQNAVLHEQLFALANQFNGARHAAQIALSTCSDKIKLLQAQVHELQSNSNTLLQSKLSLHLEPTMMGSRITAGSPSHKTPEKILTSPRTKSRRLNNSDIAESGDWVSRKTYMQVVRERNQLQQQLSTTLSNFENIHAHEVMEQSEVLEKSIRLTREQFNSRQLQIQQITERAVAAEQRLAENQKLLAQCKRERARLLHQCQENKNEILLLKDSLTFAENKNDEFLLSSNSMDEQWKELLEEMENKFEDNKNTFNRADRFMMETKIQLLERELEICRLNRPGILNNNVNTCNNTNDPMMHINSNTGTSNPDKNTPIYYEKSSAWNTDLFSNK